MSEPTGEEMTHRIAISLGYHTLPDGNWARPADKRGTIVSGPANRIVPQFHKSLDAMFIARAGFTNSEKTVYQAHLVKIAKKILDASARDHCEAFLKTKGLWPTPTEVGAAPKAKPALKPVEKVG
jgi:hypothetical protein